MEIYIIGGGASGSICALELSKNKNNHVHIIEKNNKLMKKLLLTGNGSCNFTNENFSCFNPNAKNNTYNNDFFLKSYKMFDNKSLIKYFDNIGILSTKRDRYNSTYYYPHDYSSKSVYYNILDLLVLNNVDIIYNTNIHSIEFVDNKYIIKSNTSKYFADALIIATGGKSYKKTGSDGEMFNILKNMNIKIENLLPSLCPLIFNDNKLSELKGIRALCKAKSYIDDIYAYEEKGEIQFNDNNISGIPILNISMHVVNALYNKQKVNLCLDFISDIEDVEYFYNRQKNLYNKYIKDFLSGIVDYKISSYIYEKLQITDIFNKTVSTLSKENIKNIYDILKNFNINIIDTSDFDYAQITKGGINTEEIDEYTFGIKKYNNFYAIGEVIDVDGICGGYNLQFAFTSGILCARNIDNN